MPFLKVNELTGGPVIVNMNRVERVTNYGNDHAQLWFGGADVDSMVTKESMDEVEGMMDMSLNSFPGVVTIAVLNESRKLRIPNGY